MPNPEDGDTWVPLMPEPFSEGLTAGELPTPPSWLVDDVDEVPGTRMRYDSARMTWAPVEPTVSEPATELVACGNCGERHEPGPESRCCYSAPVDGTIINGCVRCIISCSHCSQEHLASTTTRLRYVRGGAYGYVSRLCPTCAPLYTQCERCEWYADDIASVETYNIVNNEEVSPAYVIRARRDGNPTYSPYITTSLTYQTCSQCAEVNFTTCRYCERSIDTGMSWYGEHGVCHPCVVEHAVLCATCGGTELPERVSGAGECRDCRENIMRCYSFKPEPKFAKVTNERSPFYFGIELEVESRELQCVEMAEVLREELGKDWYFKRDGSLCEDYGIEIVSHPMTLAYFLEQQYDKKLESFKDDLAAFHRENCGLHIHISRNAFKDDEEHLFRFIEFHYQNEKFITFIGQRRLNDYCQLVSTVTPNVIKTRLKNNDELALGHYDAVNTENANTIELRYFRSNLLGDRLIKNMEFIRCLFEFTKTAKDNELFVPQFMHYLHKCRKKYPKLFEYVDTRNRIFIPLQPDINVSGVMQADGERAEGNYLVMHTAGIGSHVVKRRS